MCEPACVPPCPLQRGIWAAPNAPKQVPAGKKTLPDLIYQLKAPKHKGQPFCHFSPQLCTTAQPAHKCQKPARTWRLALSRAQSSDPVQALRMAQKPGTDGSVCQVSPHSLSPSCFFPSICCKPIAGVWSSRGQEGR